MNILNKKQRASVLIGKLRSQLDCPACNMPYRKPTVSMQCAHVACEACFINLVCPICQQTTSEANLREEVRIREIMKICNTLNVYLTPRGNSENINTPTPAAAKASSTESAFPSPAAKNTLTPKTSLNTSTQSSTSGRLEKKNRLGETPLHIACKKKGTLERVKTLLAQGANPNTRDNAGWSPLHEVAHTGEIEVARLLVSHGALVDVKSDDLTTPLHDAVGVGFPELIKLFLEKGADPNLKNSEGKTPLDMAVYSDEIKQLLQSYVDRHQTQQNEAQANNDAAAAAVSTAVDEKYVLMGSSIRGPLLETFKSCVTLLNAKEVSKFTSDVTHLIVPCEGEGITQRTLKYLQCIAAGKMIVSVGWTKKCLEQGCRVPEAEFEVRGCRQFSVNGAPRKSRENRVQGQPGLLSGFSLFFSLTTDKALPSIDDLKQLVELAGGVVLKKIQKNENGQPSTDTAHVRPDSILSQYKTLVVSNEYKLGDGLIYVTRDWLIDSISTFQLIEPRL